MELIYNTKRLSLQVLGPEDADKVLAFYKRNKSHLEPWESKRHNNFYTYNYQRATLGFEYELIVRRRSFRLWIILKNDPNNLIGTVNFYNISKGKPSCCQVGYKIDSNYVKKGIAYEALEFSIRLVSREFSLQRIEAKIMPSNTPSIHLIEKLGFKYEKLLKSSAKINGKWEDHLLYSLNFE